MAANVRTEDTITILEGVDRLFADAGSWGKGKREGHDVRGHAWFCTVGGAHHVAKQAGLPRASARRALREIRRAGGLLSIRAFNDRTATRLQDVRRIVKSALARAHGDTVPGMLTSEPARHGVAAAGARSRRTTP